MLEKNQRRLFRVLFLLGCVLPTLAVAGYTTARLLPGYERAVLADVSERLGLTVDCERLETPRPGVYELRGVRLGSGAACDHVRLSHRGGSWRLEAGELRLTNPEEAAGCLDALMSQGIACQGRLGVVTLDGKVPLTRVRLGIEGDTLRISSESGLAVELAAGDLRVDTAGRAVPLAWLPPTPISEGWAGEASFAGVIDIDGGEGTAVGRYELAHLRMGGLSAETGSLSESRLAWRGKRLSRLEGRLSLRNGTLAKRLMHGMIWDLEMAVSDTLRARWEDLDQARFTDAAVAVTLDEQGIRLTAQGPAIADGTTPLLAAPTRVLPVDHLVRAWHAGEAAEIPSSQSAVEMTRRLPATLARQ